MNKRTISEKMFTIFNAVILSVLSLLCLYPMLYVAFASLSDPIKLSMHQGILLSPLGFTLNGYKLVFDNPNILSGYMNTIIYVIAGTAINIAITCVGAFCFSRKDLLLKKPLFVLALFTMYFSGGIIPSYLNLQDLNLLNTRWAILLPGAISTYNMIVMCTSFATVPDSLEESARIDGANDLTIFIRIMLPLCKATLAVITLFYAVGHWNSWFSAMIYLRDRKLFPLQTILREILLSDDLQNMTNVSSLVGGDTGGVYIYYARQLVKYCTIIVATIPVLAIYPFTQRYFMKGVMIGAVKG